MTILENCDIVANAFLVTTKRQHYLPEKFDEKLSRRLNAVNQQVARLQRARSCFGFRAHQRHTHPFAAIPYSTTGQSRILRIHIRDGGPPKWRRT
jgi:hypothetical protein